MTVGEFWMGKIGSTAQAKSIVVQGSGVLFALGLMTLIAGLVFPPVLLVAGALMIGLAFAVRLSRNEIVIAAVMALLVVSAAGSVFSIVRAIGEGVLGWPPLLRILLEVILIAVLSRTFLAARFLKHEDGKPGKP